MANVRYAGATGCTQGVYILETHEWGRLGIFSKLKPTEMKALLEQVLEHDGKPITDESNKAIQAIAGKEYSDSNPGTATTYNIWDLVSALDPLIDGLNDEVWNFRDKVRGTFTYTKET